MFLGLVEYTHKNKPKRKLCRGCGYGGHGQHVPLSAHDEMGLWGMHGALSALHVLPCKASPPFFFSLSLPLSIGNGGGLLCNDSFANPNPTLIPKFLKLSLCIMPAPARTHNTHTHIHMQELEDAGVLSLPASNMNSRHMKAWRRKSARAPSVASSSMRSGVSGFRLKGAFLVGRRGSPTTPVPKWKVYDEGRMPLSLGKEQGHHHRSPNYDHDNSNVHNRSGLSPISARKLGASLWELQELPYSRGGANRTQKGVQTRQRHMLPYMDEHANTHTFPLVRPFSPASSMGSRFRASMQSEQWRHTSSTERARTYGAASMAEIRVAGSARRSLVRGIEDTSTKLGSCGQMTTNQLVKVLNRLWSLEERHACSTSLVGALRAELDQVRVQLQELLLKEKAHSKEVECVSKRMVEERALWQEQHEKSVRATLVSIRQELENERKSKQKLESLHKKVEKELRDARRKLAKVLQGLEKERKARELMEDVCDELAREVGEDKARVEELRRESVKVREEVEEERQMLQMAEVWREERVQMKLMEAKLELEEKNTALDKLRGELESFLKAKRGNGCATEEASLSQHTYKHSLDASSGLSFVDASHSNTQRGHVSGRRSVDSVKRSALLVNVEGHGSEDEDDLHSIELNNDSFIMPVCAQSGPHSFQQHGSLHKGRKSVDQRPSTACMMQRQTSGRSNDKSQGFERLRNDHVAKGGKGEVGVERNGLYDCAQVSQWIECSFEGGETRDWGKEASQRGREECVKSWHKNNGRSHELVPSSNGRSHELVSSEGVKPRGAKSGPLNDCKESIFSRNQSDWLQRVFDFENAHASSMLHNGHEGAKLMCSPTRQWTNP